MYIPALRNWTKMVLLARDYNCQGLHVTILEYDWYAFVQEVERLDL